MDFSQIILATPRLKLRELEFEDQQSIFDIYSDKETMKYWDSLPFTTLTQASEMIENVTKRRKNSIP